MKSRVSLFASVIFALSALVSTAAAQAPAVFSGVRVDLSALPAGATFARRQLGECLQRYVTESFAGRIAPRSGAPVMVVRPQFLDLSTSISNPGGSANDNDWSPDTLQGEVIFGGRRVPLLVTGAGGGSSAYPVENAARRTDELCRSFAYWLARKI
jgi:hypothetical protein